MNQLSDFYSAEDWCDDFHNLNELAEGMIGHQKIRDCYRNYYYTVHLGESWVDEGFERIVAAYCWVMKNRNELDTGDALVLGQTSGLGSSSLIEALYRYFVNHDAKIAYEEATVEQILEATAEQKKLHP